MIRIIIIDDEPLARSILKEYLKKYADMEVVQECNDGFEGVKAIMQHHPDLIFLDIQMPKINGFEMLELIDQPPAVIFTTAFDEFAIRAFEAHAVDYLLKPFSQERFDKALNKWRDYRPSQNQKSNEGKGVTDALLESASELPFQKNRVVVKTGGKIKIIPVQDIQFLEGADDYVKIHTNEGAFLKNKTMSHFEKTLDAHQFVRTHRSYIVNIQQITRLDPYEKDNYKVILKSGAQISLSKPGYVKLKAILGL